MRTCSGFPSNISAPLRTRRIPERISRWRRLTQPRCLEAEERLNGLVDHIIAHHNRKTHNRVFNAIFCVSDIKTLLKYYDLFKQKQKNGEHDLNVATIFSYQTNEDDSDASGAVDAYFTGVSTEPGNAHDRARQSQVRDHEQAYGADYPTDSSYQYSDSHSRDRLENCIRDYNKAYGTNYKTDTFYEYYRDIGKRVRYRQKNRNTGEGIDILLVVNMFLTGFDSQWLNTIYVDKNLRYHGTGASLLTHQSHPGIEKVTRQRRMLPEPETGY